MLDEGVVAAPEDIDLCMILGAGWPFHLGGITPYLDRTGIAAKVNGAPVPPAPAGRDGPCRREPRREVSADSWQSRKQSCGSCAVSAVS